MKKKTRSCWVAAVPLNCHLEGLTDLHLRSLNTNGRTPAVHRFCLWLFSVNSSNETLKTVPHPPSQRLEVDIFIFSTAGLYVFVLQCMFLQQWFGFAQSSCKYAQYNHAGPCLVWLLSIYCSLSLCINPHNPSVYLIQCAVDLKPQWTRRADRHQDHFTWRGWADWLTYLEDTFGLVHSFAFVFFALHPDNFSAPLIFPLLSVDVFLNSFSSFPVSSHISFGNTLFWLFSVILNYQVTKRRLDFVRQVKFRPTEPWQRPILKELYTFLFTLLLLMLLLLKDTLQS